MTLIIGSIGKALKDAKPEVLADGVNPKSIAARMTRARWSDTWGRFNRKLDYPPLGLA
jgi:hypothetical protein